MTYQNDGRPVEWSIEAQQAEAQMLAALSARWELFGGTIAGGPGVTLYNGHAFRQDTDERGVNGMYGHKSSSAVAGWLPDLIEQQSILCGARPDTHYLMLRIKPEVTFDANLQRWMGYVRFAFLRKADHPQPVVKPGADNE